MAEQFAHTILLDKEELDRLNRILAFNPAKNQELIQSEDPVVRARVNEIYEEDLFYRTVDFPDGKTFTLRMIPSDGEYPAYVEATLDDAEGLRVAFHDDDGRLDVPWRLEDIDGNAYTINIQAREREMEPLDHTISLDKERLEHLNRLLAFVPVLHAENPDYENLRTSKDPVARAFAETIGQEYPLFETRIPFSNGNSMTIGVYPPKDATHPITARAFLDSAEGEELARSDDEYSLDGPWELQDREGKRYTVGIQGRERDADKTKADSAKQATPTLEADAFEDMLTIEPEKLDYLKRILSVNPSDYITPATKDRLYEVDNPAIQEFVDSIGETPLFQESFPYPDGNTAIFTVWPPSDETSPAYADMCLYVDGDAHIYDGQNNSQDPLEGKWEVTDPHTGHIYTLNVEERKRAIDKTPLAERLAALREKTFKALDASQTLPAEARGKDYATLAHELPETLAALKHELARRIPQEPTSIDKRAGEYLATGRIDWKPFGETAQKEAETLVPALCTFAEKMATVEDTFLKAKETNLPEGCVPPDIVQYKDAVMELRKAAPTILRDHLFVADFSREKEHFLQDNLERSYREAVKNINFLRGNTPLKGKESLAEKTMRKVYSEHKDTVDYDKLNQETVARLIKKGASDKTIREVAEIAKILNPTIQDTKAYAKALTAQAKQSREAARG